MPFIATASNKDCDRTNRTPVILMFSQVYTNNSKNFSKSISSDFYHYNEISKAVYKKEPIVISDIDFLKAQYNFDGNEIAFAQYLKDREKEFDKAITKLSEIENKGTNKDANKIIEDHNKTWEKSKTEEATTFTKITISDFFTPKNNYPKYHKVRSPEEALLYLLNKKIKSDEKIELLYSGHGMSHDGEFHMISASFDLPNINEPPENTFIFSDDVDQAISASHAIRLSSILDKTNTTGAVLDACYSGEKCILNTSNSNIKKTPYILASALSFQIAPAKESGGSLANILRKLVTEKNPPCAIDLNQDGKLSEREITLAALLMGEESKDRPLREILDKMYLSDIQDNKWNHGKPEENNFTGSNASDQCFIAMPNAKTCKRKNSRFLNKCKQALNEVSIMKENLYWLIDQKPVLTDNNNLSTQTVKTKKVFTVHARTDENTSNEMPQNADKVAAATFVDINDSNNPSSQNDGIFIKNEIDINPTNAIPIIPRNIMHKDKQLLEAGNFIEAWASDINKKTHKSCNKSSATCLDNGDFGKLNTGLKEIIEAITLQ